MRLGLYGGSFDPVHYGHLLLAECCREELALDAVWFLPAAVSPFKTGRTETPAKHRVEMLKLALAGHEAMNVSTLEIDRGGVSYTVETLAGIREQQPQAELFFLMGGDSLRDLPSWREPGRICELAIPVVVPRPDAPPVDYDVLRGVASPERLEVIRRREVQMPQINLSNTDLRRRVAAGQSIRYRTPRAVEKYIETHALYREGDEEESSGLAKTIPPHQT
ncbi:MAG: nicotinate-nucleotide adenylyltransferase [Planctomycetes bacterium]|nr:nicotinate-nucleotide adenylyltransferase [Planctomycetota bacterium]